MPLPKGQRGSTGGAITGQPLLRDFLMLFLFCFEEHAGEMPSQRYPGIWLERKFLQGSKASAQDWLTIRQWTILDYEYSLVRRDLINILLFSSGHFDMFPAKIRANLSSISLSVSLFILSLYPSII